MDHVHPEGASGGPQGNVVAAAAASAVGPFGEAPSEAESEPEHTASAEGSSRDTGHTPEDTGYPPGDAAPRYTGPPLPGAKCPASAECNFADTGPASGGTGHTPGDTGHPFGDAVPRHTGSPPSGTKCTASSESNSGDTRSAATELQPVR